MLTNAIKLRNMQIDLCILGIFGFFGINHDILKLTNLEMTSHETPAFTLVMKYGEMYLIEGEGRPATLI